MTTILLHGFWGQPEDWNAVLGHLPLSATVHIPDLYKDSLLSPRPLPEWVENFWRWVAERKGEAPVQLVGYSMGGRLALNAAVRSPGRVARALFASANPWLSEEAFAERAAWENDWRQKFMHVDWTHLESVWDDQSVFRGSHRLARRREPALRAGLGASLSEWSPRHHLPALKDLRALPATWDWTFGALDQKYMAVAKTLQELPVRGQISILPDAGHRLPSDAPAFLARWIEGAFCAPVVANEVEISRLRIAHER